MMPINTPLHKELSDIAKQVTSNTYVEPPADPDEPQSGQVTQATVVSEDELRAEAANNFARALTELTGTPFRISVVQRFTAQRSHLTLQALTSQALSMQESMNRMHESIRNTDQAITSMLGNHWPREGGDLVLINVLLRMTQSIEEADTRIGRVLLNAMIRTTARHASRSKAKSTPPDSKTPGVTLVHLSESSSCLLYTSPSPRDLSTSRMPSSA